MLRKPIQLALLRGTLLARVFDPAPPARHISLQPLPFPFIRPEIADAFRTRLPDAVSNAAATGDKKIVKSIERMIDIWGDRSASD